MPFLKFEPYHNIAEFLESFPKGGLVVEVGVLFGTHAEKMYKHLQPDRMILIDTWGNYHAMATGEPLKGDQVFQECQKKFCHRENVQMWRGWSTTLIPVLKDRSVDFAFIDAGHWEEECLADLEAMLPKMKPGGWLCGHDYCEIYQYGVVRAVAVFLDRHKDLGLKLNKLTNYPLEPVLRDPRKYYQSETACNSYGIFIP